MLTSFLVCTVNTEDVGAVSLYPLALSAVASVVFRVKISVSGADVLLPWYTAQFSALLLCFDIIISGTAPKPWAIVPVFPVPVVVIIENPAVVFVCIVPPGLLPLSVKDDVVPPLAFHCHAT